MIKAGSKLPSEYQEVEYIESSGTQYIDTGFKPSGKTKIITDLTTRNIPYTNRFFYGSRDGLGVGGFACGTQPNLIGSYGRNNTFDYNVITKYTRYLIEQTNKLIVNGTEYYSYVQQDFRGSNNLLVFALYNGATGVDFKSNYRLHSMKIYDDDILVRNFVPCYRKNDNVIGLYDLVNNVFYTNQGGGTFEKGKVILATIKTIKLYKDNSTNEIKYIKTRSNNLLKFHYDQSLPYTIKGITFDEISEGIVNVTGEKTDSGYATLYIGWDRVTLKAGKTYVMGQNLTITCYKAADSSWYGNVSYVITPTEDLVTAGGYIATNQATPNFNAYVMLIEGDTKPNYYVPYMAKVFDQLPSEYQRVEYIQSSYEQYIDTGINADNKLRVVLNMQYISSLNGNRTYMGAIYDYNNSRYARYHLMIQDGSYLLYYNDNARYTDKTADTNVHIFDIDIPNQVFYIDNSKYSLSYFLFDTTLNFWLFGRNSNNDTLKYLNSTRLYSCKMYYEGVLVRNFVPCYKKSNNEIGMYDLISNTFYTNGGTGTFIKGNNI